MGRYGAQYGPDITFLGIDRCTLDEPETYGLPPAPEDPVRDVGETWAAAGAAALALGAALVAAVFGGRR